jgi:hypothetical protein
MDDPSVLDSTLPSSIAPQLMSGSVIEASGKRILVLVRRTSANRLRTASFTMQGRQYTAIEQNPDKPSRWGQLARAGHQVVQFKDVETNRFVAVAVDGQVTVYGRRRRPS